jgi:hypothetical protein
LLAHTNDRSTWEPHIGGYCEPMNQRHTQTFLDLALVHCPACDRQAEVRPHRDGLRLTCSHCGRSETTGPRERGDKQHPALSLISINAERPPFGAALWLETICCGGNRLWALNEKHLDYLTQYVAETQRSREFPSPPGSRQLATVLPTWMKLAKNRDEVLRAIARLRTRL